jgi:hemolysin III
VYHGATVPEETADRFMRMDHCAIYVLIAGTYTPVCLLVLNKTIGIPMLIAQYTLAAIGILLIHTCRSAPHFIRVTLYLLMGWMIVLDLGHLRMLMPPEGIAWIIAGGVTYTIGCIVFAIDKPHLWPGRFSAHDLWHVFVLAASACQFYAIWRFIALIR